MISTGLLGGSFNPVHAGHIKLARRLVDDGLFDEVWFNLSPLNPLKTSATDLAPDADRAEMLRLALDKEPGLAPCLIELDMPRPSYTIDTLRLLAAKHPDRHFSLIIGSDNWLIFNKWREADSIINEFGVTVYPRPGYEICCQMPDGARMAEGVPVADISSSEIRNGSVDPSLWLNPEVNAYIKARKLYD